MPTLVTDFEAYLSSGASRRTLARSRPFFLLKSFGEMHLTVDELGQVFTLPNGISSLMVESSKPVTLSFSTDTSGYPLMELTISRFSALHGTIMYAPTLTGPVGTEISVIYGVS